MDTKIWAGLVFLLVAVSYGETRPAFEVASVKRIRDYSPHVTMNGDISHGRLTLNNAHVKQMIAVAYEIQSVRIEGGPGWIDSDQFQIVAKAENPQTTDQQVRVMLQNLLTDRFQLRIRREMKLLPSYTLRIAAGGAKLERAKEEGTDRCDRTMEGGRYELACRHIQIVTLANALALLLRGPVVDQTGLPGDYDFALTWEGDDTYSAVPDAVEKFGLRLENNRRVVANPLHRCHLECRPRLSVSDCNQQENESSPDFGAHAR
jgi:uncharacterized protein (TIGR03435 family)